MILATSSLRAQRSNPESFRGGSLDCFVARAPRNDEDRAAATYHNGLPRRSRPQTGPMSARVHIAPP
ncbi:hypothetical protein EAS61_07370 [Bradyrhizobium zhanjiangense]|uniref:Uncharacterized protein n=1 Tax=Bradyrhizobium zhanjiangense TaxID=1325107 RepID=A0A4Q0QVI6_9BRAD|nr:hypothetical protein EAS61_07370 [Bradyrhizobium zhanjiangense]